VIINYERKNAETLWVDQMLSFVRF